MFTPSGAPRGAAQEIDHPEDMPDEVPKADETGPTAGDDEEHV